MKRFRFVAVMALAGVCCLAAPRAGAAPRFAAIFRDYMVLQRDRPVPVWGWADPGEAVQVVFMNTTNRAVADATGRWQVSLGPYPAGGPFEMVLAGNPGRTIRDILIGDVWHCAGQSNMQWSIGSMADAAEVLADADYPEIRLVTIWGAASLEPKRDLHDGYPSTHWRPCSSNTARIFSAPGFFFARDLYRHLKIPLGVIATAEGSSPIRAWISPETQRTNPLFKPILDDYATYAERKKPYLAYLAARKKAKEDGTPEPPFPGFFEAYGDGPGMFYNSRIDPLAPFGIRGAIWWQGGNEAIYKHGEMYRDLLPILIQDWRARWGQGDFPFIVVQLSPIGGKAAAPGESEWAWVRDGQRRATALTNTALVVTMDILEATLHPVRKAAMGPRLAAAARALAYGEPIVYSGPLVENARFADGRVVLTFKHVGGGLAVRGEHRGELLVPGRAGVRHAVVVYLRVLQPRPFPEQFHEHPGIGGHGVHQRPVQVRDDVFQSFVFHKLALKI